MGSTIAEEIGVFGHRPSVLMDMLAGKRVDVDIEVRSYRRTFFGDCSPFYFETALQVCFIILNSEILAFNTSLNFSDTVSIILYYIYMTENGLVMFTKSYTQRLLFKSFFTRRS